MSSVINLQPRDAIILKAIFRTHAPLAEIWAYGCRVTNQGSQTNECNLAIRNAAALDTPMANLATLRSAIKDSLLHGLVHLHDWALLPEGHRREIAAGHVVLITPCQSQIS